MPRGNGGKKNPSFMEQMEAVKMNLELLEHHRRDDDIRWRVRMDEFARGMTDLRENMDRLAERSAHEDASLRSSIMMLANQADQERERGAELGRHIDRIGDYIMNHEQRIRKVEKRAS